MEEAESCPPLKEILSTIHRLPVQKLGSGGFSTVFLFHVLGKSYAVKIIPIENETHIEEFKTEVLNWKTANQNPRLQTIIPTFCESALIPVETIRSFEYPIDSVLELNTEWRHPEMAIAYGFIFTKSTNYVPYYKLPHRYEITTQIIDNLIQALDVLHKEDYIHGDIKLENILIKPDLGIYFIDLAGLCKLPCTRSIPTTQNYLPPDFATFTKSRFRFQKPGTLLKKNRRKTKITNKTFTRFSKEMDKYAMGKIILHILTTTVAEDPRWGNDASPEDKQVRETYYQKAYQLIRYPIHIYASEIGLESQTKKNTPSITTKQNTRRTKNQRKKTN